MSEFEALLARSGLSRAELAKRLRIHPGSISRWGDDAPGYAISYLELYVGFKEYIEAGRDALSKH